MSAKGFRTQSFDDFRDGAKWTMRKGHDVRLRWPESFPRIEAPLHLFIRAKPSDHLPLAGCTRSVWVRTREPIEPGSEIPIDAPLDGAWEVTYDLIDERSDRGTLLEFRPAQVLAIADVESPQDFTIDVDAASLARAIAGVHPH